MITDVRAQEAFHWLENNTSKIGAAKAELERSEILRKRTRKRAFLSEAEDADTVVFWMSVPDKIYRIRCEHKNAEAYHQ